MGEGGLSRVGGDVQVIAFTIAGEPVAQGRPRATIVAGKPSLRDPENAKEWKGQARWQAKRILDENGVDGLPFPEGPVHVIIRAFHSCPKADRRKTMEVPARWRAKRPDIENIAKAVLDALTSVLWTDDAQVARLVVEHKTAGQHEAPRVELEVAAL